MNGGPNASIAVSYLMGRLLVCYLRSVWVLGVGGVVCGCWEHKWPGLNERTEGRTSHCRMLDFSDAVDGNTSSDYEWPQRA